jgi:sarcosine oxidase subunit alpha
VAGLGHLPEAAAPVSPGERRSVDAVVVGGGAAGIAAASTLAAKGLRVVLADDGVRLGGSLRGLGADSVARAVAAFPLDRVEVRSRTVVAGIYEREALLVGPNGAAVLSPRVFVLATGAHDGQPLFEGNDLPGVMSARAVATLAAEGIAVGTRLVIAGDGPFARAASRLLAARAEITRIALDGILRVEGSTRLGGVVVRDGSGEKRLRADALAIEMDGAPAFELASQLGAKMTWAERGFTPAFDESGQCAEGAFVAGELRGVPVDEERLLESGRVAAEAALRSLALAR